MPFATDEGAILPAALAQSHLAAYVLIDLAIILVALRIGGRAARLVGQPRVVGEIAAGILIGPTILGGHIATQTVAGAGLVDRVYPAGAVSFLNLTGQVGLVLYMFLVGLEINPRLLQGRGRQILILTGSLSVVPLMLGVACAGAFGGGTWRAPGVDNPAFALFVGAAITTVALPVIAHLIQEKGLLDTPVACLGLVVGSAVTVVAFVAVGVAGEVGGAGSGHLGARLGWMAALIAVAVAIIRPTLGWALARLDTSGSSSTALVGLLALSLAAGAAADWVGVAPLVGGLLVGLATPASPALKAAIVNRMKGAVLLVFMPVFFASSGLRTDLRLLETKLLPGVLLFVALIVVAKWAPAYLVARATGLAAPEANALGALLGSGGMLALVMGAIGIEDGIITAQMQVIVVLGALITLVPIGPLMERLRSPARPTLEGP